MSHQDEGGEKWCFLEFPKYRCGEEGEIIWLRNTEVSKITSWYSHCLQQLIHQIVREELAEFEQDIELQDMIIKELSDEWIWNQFEEYESNFYEELDDEATRVFCPVCQRNVLQLNENIITCPCGLRLYYPLSLSEFLESILLSVKKHEQFCSNTINFFAEPKEGFNIHSLHAACSNCDFYNTIIN